MVYNLKKKKEINVEYELLKGSIKGAKRYIEEKIKFLKEQRTLQTYGSPEWASINFALTEIWKIYGYIEGVTNCYD